MLSDEEKKVLQQLEEDEKKAPKAKKSLPRKKAGFPLGFIDKPVEDFIDKNEVDE
jgi:hypothetical protein